MMKLIFDLESKKDNKWLLWCDLEERFLCRKKESQFIPIIFPIENLVTRRFNRKYRQILVESKTKK